jgi:superoxide dismutase, Fe-Mn family
MTRFSTNHTFQFAVVICLALGVVQCNTAGDQPTFSQEPLPYRADALEPHITAETMTLHYGKHHARYVATANRLLDDSPFRGKAPVEVLRLTAGKGEHAAIFNHAAQAWNHAFFWKSLQPGGGGVPTGRLAEEIDTAFGSFDRFKKRFASTAGSLFGSGWVWLVKDGDTLKVIATANADTPAAHGLIPLFTTDVWEHAYYLDYHNRRAEYVAAVMDHLANWDFVASQLGAGPTADGNPATETETSDSNAQAGIKK